MERSLTELRFGSALSGVAACVSAALAAEMVAEHTPGAASVFAGITAVSLASHFSYKTSIEESLPKDE